MDIEALTRQRIDYAKTPEGGLRAVLTVTLPDGVVRTFAADLVDSADVAGWGSRTTEAARVLGGAEVGAGWWLTPKERGPLGYAKGKLATDRFRATTYDAQAMQKFMRALMRGDLPKATNAPSPEIQRLISIAPQIASDQRVAAIEWSKFPKATRDGIRKKYGPPSGLEKFGKAAFEVIKVVAPLALNLIVPGSGFIASAAVLASGAIKAVKDVKRVADAVSPALPPAKKFLQSELMQHAAAELAKEGAATVAPVARTAALTAAGVLGITGKLGKAQVQADAGHVALAKATAQHALIDARTITRSPESAKKLIALANAKRLAAEAIAHGISPAAAARDRKVQARKPTPKDGGDVLAAARRGGLRSTKGGAVSESELLKAARDGRVYWVHA
jgi:hypothetical protein